MGIIIGNEVEGNNLDTSEIKIELDYMSECPDTSFFGIRPCYICNKYKTLKTSQYFNISEYPEKVEPFIKELGSGVVCSDCKTNFKDNESIKSRIRADFLIKILQEE